MTKSASLASAAAAVREHVRTLAPGQAFGVRQMLEHGSRAAVDQALSRMFRAGELERPARGVYAVPKVNKTLGRRVPTEPAQVVNAIAHGSGARIGVGGAEAARRFGFTTQVPVRSVYATTGRTRRLRLPTGEVTLQHASPRRMSLAGTPAGEALAALLYLGRAEVSEATIARVRSALPPAEFSALRTHTSAMPAWLSDAMYRSTSGVGVSA